MARNYLQWLNWTDLGFLNFYYLPTSTFLNYMYHLAFDAKRLFTNFTGLGNYSRTLVRNLSEYYPDHAYFLLTPRVVRNAETQFFLSSPAFSVHQPTTSRSVLWRSRGMKRDWKRHQIDLYHGLSHEIPFGAQRTGIPTVVTIHDLIFKHYPSQYAWVDRQVYDRKYRYACQRADLIIAISEQTKKDIIQFYGVDPARIEVIYQACSERFLQKRSQKTIEEVLTRYQLPSEYNLYVGSIIERKNLLGILQAYRQLPETARIPLAIVGAGDRTYTEQVQRYARDHQLQSYLYWLRPDSEDLPALYQQARLFLYPSFYEGFGIPIIEALFSETPVITSNRSSLPEAAGPSSQFVDPESPEAISSAIERLLQDTDQRNAAIQTGRAHAEQFRGEPLSHQLMNVYDRLLS